MSNFVHLHVHSEYSLLDGSSRIDELPKYAKELGMDAIALTDHGNMYGAIAFYKACLREGVKPIMGAEVYVAKNGLEVKTQPDERYHLVLLAENINGYKNLMKIVSKAFVDGYYYKPRVDLDYLKDHSNGIIATSACLGGEVQRNLALGNKKGARDAAIRLNEIFGDGNFFLELQNHGISEEYRVNEGLIELSKELGIGLVATNDAHYLKKSDAKVHDLLLCIQTGKTVSDEDRMKFKTDEFYLKSPQEMSELFKEVPEAISNTVEIAKRCNVEITFHELHLPHFEVPLGYTNESYLRELALKGLEKKYEIITKEIKDRFEFELKTITQMGYTDYFLIVWDFIRYAHENNIMVGPGRGSAAGSIISYALDIIDVDPLKFDLLFERFLNPDRVSMPDIDIDFCYERREEVIEYVIEKYGYDHVAQIVTFGTMASRGAIRDVGRALDLPYARVDYIAKQIPQALNMTIEKALEISSGFKKLYEEDPRAKELIDFAKEVEGLPRHTSTHAAGVVISKEELTNYVPLTRNKDIIATEFNMIELEELGLLKMDFLGLRTLTVIRDAITQIEKNYGVKVDFDKLDYDDPLVLKMFARAETLGVFQFESSGMRLFLKDLKPDAFEDLVAANALFRPGPMKQIPKFVNSKHKRLEVSYLHPSLEEILKVTYGCIVYQEQVIQIVKKIGGYSIARADLVRRAISKKKMSVMEQERKNFIYGNEKEEVCGAIANGIDEKSANLIYDQIIDFADYAFNKSHSVAYSVVAYRTAWLKYYYPREFMAAQISTYTSDTNQVALYIEEVKRLGIEILPPDINKSENKFVVEDGNIRFGLKAVKGIGDKFIDAIVAGRKNSPYTSMVDFVTKVHAEDPRAINKRAVEALIKCGAFDSFEGNRAQLLAIYEKVISSLSSSLKNNISGQFSLFDKVEIKDELPNLRDFTKSKKLEMEKEVIGIYVSGHPLDSYKNNIRNFSNTGINNINEMYREGKEISKSVKLAGLFKNKKQMITKTNKMMAFGVLEDFYSNIELVIFPNVYEKFNDILVEDKVLGFSGHISASDVEEPKLMVDSVIDLDQDSQKTLYISVSSLEDERLKEIKKVLKTHPGAASIRIYSEKDKKVYGMDGLSGVDEASLEELKNSLDLILGDGKTVIKT